MPKSSSLCLVCNDDAFRALCDSVTADDLDRAISLGLLNFEPPGEGCEKCAPRIAALLAARDARLHALAARERYRARQTRLAERAEARVRKRASAAPAPSAAVPSLPPGAAAALARAKARAAAKPRPE
jgi:hypothetical protein